MSAPYALDVRYWPLVVFDVPADTTHFDLATLRASQDAVLARRERYVTLTNVTAVTRLPGAAVRAELGAWLRETDEARRRWHVADVLVMSNPLVRGAVTAVQWLAPPSVPTLVCGEFTEALDFLEKHALRAGLDARGFAAFRRERLDRKT